MESIWPETMSPLRATFDLIWYTELNWLKRNTPVGILQTKTLLLYLVIRGKLLHSDQHLWNRQVALCPFYPLLKMHRSWGPFHETHRNLRLIVALTMHHSLLVLAMDFLNYDGLSIVSQDTINRSASWNRPQDVSYVTKKKLAPNHEAQQQGLSLENSDCCVSSKSKVTRKKAYWARSCYTGPPQAHLVFEHI